MKLSRIIFPILVMLLISSCKKMEAITPTPSNSNEITFLDTKIIFPTKADSKELLGTSDVYSKGLSIFDIQAKTQNLNAKEEADYLSFAKAQAQEWTLTELTNLKASIAIAEANIKSIGLILDLPEVKIVKSSSLEEGGAAYTRGDYIVFTADNAKNGNEAPLFLHELFHVFSRANPTKRDELYALIGFNKCNNIEFPATLSDRKMTNPDAPILQHYISVEIDGQMEDAVIVLVANADYTGGNFFNYLTKQLMILEGDNIGKGAKLINGVADLRSFDSPINLVTQIGTNTNYNIHPEEISAEHFRLLVLGETVPEPTFLNKMKAILD